GVPTRPDATGSIVGLRSDVSRADIARAAYSGVVCGLLEGLDALLAQGVPASGRVLLVGGGAQSRAYRQLLADLSGRAVTVPVASELAAAGACVQAAAALQGVSPLAVAIAWGFDAGIVVDARAVDRDAIRSRYAQAAHG